MERIDFNQGRIAWCCEDSGITLSDLAVETGVSEATLDKAVSGERGLTFNQLKKIADHFGRGVLFFMEPGPADPAKVHTAAFRSIANQKPDISAKLRTLIERAERQRDVYLNLRDEIGSDDEPVFNPPQLPRNPQEAASIARQWLGLSNENDFDHYRAAVERKGILVFRSNGYNGQWQIAKDNPVLGFSLYDHKCPLILVKKQYWDASQTFTLMHELGHILLHKMSSVDDDTDLHHVSGSEREANEFAGLVLVPDSHLSTIDARSMPEQAEYFDEWLAPYRRRWGVSGEVILRRLLDSGRLSGAQYGAYRAWRSAIKIPEQESGGSRGYRYREPRHIFGDGFVRVVLDSLTARNITLAKASTYLDGIKVKDIHNLKGYYVGV
jgi:Zn-dependent peptidase ImmA (M78 family)